MSVAIPEKLYFTIGEVARLARVKPHVLRFWEQEFPRLSPRKDEAGRRVYRKKDVELVLEIRDLLYDRKFTIAGARQHIMDADVSTAGQSAGTDPEIKRELQFVLSLLKDA